MDFNNKYLWKLFEINGETVYVTETLLATWIIMGVLILFAVIVRLKLKSFKEIPKGFQNVVEMLVESTSKFTKDTMGKELEFFGGWFFSIAAFILLSNYSGLFFLRPPTTNLATTAALALLTFILIHATGIIRQKGTYFKNYFSPNPLFFPLNLIGELATPISLSFRLFGNILGGLIIMGIVYHMFPLVLQFLVPSVLHAYFDLFSGGIQTFIFVMLSMVFIQDKAYIED